MRGLISAVLWTLGGIYYGGFLLLALCLSYLLPFRTFDPLLKALCRGLFRILFVRVTVRGEENLDPTESYIFLANHSSLLDVPLVAGFVPGFLRGIEASTQHRWPLYGWVMGRLGNIPIERGDVHASIGTMKRAQDYLETGGSLIIFPEGYRTTTGKLLPFKKLPFHLALRCRRPIAPVTIHGLFQVNNKTSRMIYPGPVSLVFEKVIPPEEYEEMDAVQLRDLVRARMLDALEDPTPP